MIVAASFTDINFALSFWTVVTFSLLLVVLGKFAWGPILSMIEQREKTISEAIESAKNQRVLAEKAATEMKDSLDKARLEAAELSRRSQAEVLAAKAELMTAAKKESEDLLVLARKTIQEERRQAISEIRASTVELAMAAAQKLVQSQMDVGKQKALVEEAIAQLTRDQRS